VDELHMLDVPVEEAAPIDLADLQRSAVDGLPGQATMANRSSSHPAALSDAHGVTRSASRTGTLYQPPSPPIGSSESVYQTPGSPTGNQFRSSSAPMRSSTFFEPIVEEQAHGLAIGMPEHGHVHDSMSSPHLQQQGEGFQRSVSGPGLVSYGNPQTLIGQRETFLRNKSQGNLIATLQDPMVNSSGPGSEVGSLSNYPMYAAAFADPDDLPLSQRKQYMRQSSMMSLSQSSPVVAQGPNGIEVSEMAPFDSHQPKRNSQSLTSTARQAQMANFRQSIAQELRSGTPILPKSGRETPFGSTNDLLASREAEVQRGIEAQRNMMLGQKEADAQRREMQRREKEWAERLFDDRMRNGDFHEAHREVMRKMQRKAKDQG
jgi:hypothetical protein